MNPARLVGPLLVAGGILAMVAPPIVDGLGPTMRRSGAGEILTMSALAFFAPAAVLSAVPPIVVKIRLSTLAETGAVVGSYSATGTAGAIFGTFVTGFVLISAWPTRPIVLVVGVVLVVWGAFLIARSGLRTTLGMVALPAVAAASLLAFLGWAVRTGNRLSLRLCDSAERRRQSSVARHPAPQLRRPRRPEKPRISLYEDHGRRRRCACSPGSLDVVFIGGGGFTLPRYFPAVRAGSTSTVLEIDGDLVDFVVTRLGLDRTDPAIRVRIGDARLLVADEPPGTVDLIVGDAFGGMAVPWHLTTEEFTRLLADRLAPHGIYVLNLIDQPPLRFARAEAATLATVFTHVAIVAPPAYLDGTTGGNYVLIGSQRPIDAESISDLAGARGSTESVIVDSEVFAFIDGARPLTDDFAPVDQMISR